jgi:hypothetical protein
MAPMFTPWGLEVGFHVGFQYPTISGPVEWETPDGAADPGAVVNRSQVLPVQRVGGMAIKVPEKVLRGG